MILVIFLNADVTSRIDIQKKHETFFDRKLLTYQGGILSGILVSRMTRNTQISGEISDQKAFQLILEPKYLKSSQKFYLGNCY